MLTLKNLRKSSSTQGSIFWSENDIYSTPLSEMIFFPLSRHAVFRLISCPVCLNSSLLYLFTSYFLFFFLIFSFSFSFSLFLSPFFLFLSPPKDTGRNSPSREGGGGFFPINRPLLPQSCKGRVLFATYAK